MAEYSKSMVGNSIIISIISNTSLAIKLLQTRTGQKDHGVRHRAILGLVVAAIIDLPEANQDATWHWQYEGGTARDVVVLQLVPRAIKLWYWHCDILWYLHLLFL